MKVKTMSLCLLVLAIFAALSHPAPASAYTICRERPNPQFETCYADCTDSWDRCYQIRRGCSQFGDNNMEICDSADDSYCNNASTACKQDCPTNPTTLFCYEVQ